MQRRDFISKLLTAGAVLQLKAQTPGVTFERPLAGTPHKGKVLAAIQPHSDDVPILCGGTVAKLLKEGYTGYMIRATNDDMGDDIGEPGTIGDNVLRNERETDELTRVMGLQRKFDLNYSNHRMGGISQTELQLRLIFLFRLLTRSLGPRRRESRPLCAGPLRQSGLLDGRPRARLSGAFPPRTQDPRRERKVLLRPPSRGHPRGGYQRDRRQ